MSVSEKWGRRKKIVSFSLLPISSEVVEKNMRKCI
jgi:hypothetical protein